MMRSRGSVDMQRIPVIPVVCITMTVRGCQVDTRHSIVLLSLVRFIASRVFNRVVWPRFSRSIFEVNFRGDG